MRCSYCYEWNELGDRARASLELLEKVFRAIKSTHETREAALPSGTRTVSNVLLHGGEPLILPVSYLRAVFALAHAVFGSTGALPTGFRISAQTNLVSVSDDMIGLLLENRIGVGVSFDVVPGVRRLVSGGESESRVLLNMDRLRARGVPMAGLAVVARHTAPRITDVYDFFAARAMPLRVLPLFDGPSERPERDFSIDNDSLADALLVLFRHWIDTGSRVRVDPLNEWLTSVLRKMLGVRGPLYDRRVQGDDVLLVNTDGKVFRVPDVYDAALALGDLNRQRWDDIVRSESYAASLRRDDAVVQAHCAACDYAGSCSGRPVVLSKRSGPARGRCPVAFACHEGIEQYLRASGCDETALVSLLEEGLQERAEDELNRAASAA